MPNQVPSSPQAGIYSQVTRDIKVTVLPSAIAEQSDPEGSEFAFAYTVTIHNAGQETVQLLERHWVIVSNGEQIGEVVGPGVVGEQPVLKPGQEHTYTSGAVIHDPVGSMHGSYTFKSVSGEYFQVTIPKFDLLYPLVLH